MITIKASFEYVLRTTYMLRPSSETCLGNPVFHFLSHGEYIALHTHAIVD